MKNGWATFKRWGAGILLVSGAGFALTAILGVVGVALSWKDANTRVVEAVTLSAEQGVAFPPSYSILQPGPGGVSRLAVKPAGPVLWSFASNLRHPARVEVTVYAPETGGGLRPVPEDWYTVTVDPYPGGQQLTLRSTADSFEIVKVVVSLDSGKTPMNRNLYPVRWAKPRD